MMTEEAHASARMPAEPAEADAHYDPPVHASLARAIGSRSEGGHPRHRRIPIILESACEDPSALIALLGEARIASLTGFPEAAISSFTRSRTNLQRRFAARMRERLGLSRRQVAASRRIPADTSIILRAVSFFATTMRLADTPRVVSRETMRRNAAEYGEEALAFALIQKPLLGQSIEALREFISEPPISDADKRMFVRALAAHGHDGAPAIALLLDLPVEIATRGFADRFDAVITGLPTLAARALTRVTEDMAGKARASAATDAGHSAMPSPEDISAAEAQWREDGLADSQPAEAGGAGEDTARDGAGSGAAMTGGENDTSAA